MVQCNLWYMEQDIRKRMAEAGIYPAESRGQHIITNGNILDAIADNVNRGGVVLEVGAGPGNLTERLARKAKSVVAVEIDRQFEPILSELQTEHPNVKVVYKDVLRLNLENTVRGGLFRRECQVFGNLPFHITEPFLKQLITLPITDAVLVLGEQMTSRIRKNNPLDFGFSRTGLTVQTFFESSELMKLPSRFFYPEPGTDSALVVLTPRDKSEFTRNKKMAILRKLFLTESKHSPVGKIIKEAYGTVDDSVTRDKRERNRYERRQTRQDLNRMTKRGFVVESGNNKQFDSGDVLLQRTGLNSDILNRPFSSLDNQDLGTLVLALDRL